MTNWYTQPMSILLIGKCVATYNSVNKMLQYNTTIWKARTLYADKRGALQESEVVSKQYQILYQF